MLELLKAHWRPLALLAALLLAFALGRFATPPKTVTARAEADHTVELQLAQARQQVNKLAQQVETLKTRKHEVKVTVIDRKKGTKTVTDTKDTSTDQSTHTQEQAQAVATTQTATQGDATHTVSTSVTVDPAKPQWRASLLAGVDVLHLDRPALFGPIQLGGMVERRIRIANHDTPLWVGAWGMSSGTGGLALSLEF